MEKRLIVAIAMSMLIIIAFQHFVAKPVPAPRNGPNSVKTNLISPSEESQLKAVSSAETFGEEKEFEVETDKYLLNFSNVGGAIKRVRLKDYTNPGSTEPLDLAEIKNPREYIYSISSSLSSVPLDTSLYNLEKDANAVTYSLKSPNLEIVKKYILHKSNNSIELNIAIKNISDTPTTFSYRIIGGSGVIETSIQDKRFVEVISKVNGQIVNFKNPKDNRILHPGIVSWTALKNKYFSIILKPFVETKNQFYGETKNKSLYTGIDTQDVNIPPKSFIEQKFVIYVGPSKISALKAFGFEFEESVNYGWFGWIAKAMLSLMGIVYNLVHSWGFSIIILSIFLNMLLFPLSLQSFKSMKKMQELHPQMEKLKIQHKDNPQKLNKEIMELYKKYKINPLSGCLPILLQMPIFVALYQALMKSIDLRGAKFLWIKDLSSPDAVKIPFTLPIIGNSINILPILMLIGMVVQQKISATSTGAAVTEEQKQQQKMMLILMPVMFGFIFYNMPSGLVLYWVINTMLTIGEQYIVFKKI